MCYAHVGITTLFKASEARHLKVMRVDYTSGVA